MWRNLKLQLLTQYGLFIVFALFIVIESIATWNGGSHKIFESPDANVNYQFTARLASGLPLGIPIEISTVSNYLTPRSAYVRDGYIVPVGFVGLVALYAFVASIFSLAVIPYLTLLLAVLGLMHFYWLLRKLFSPQMAWWSVVLTMMHPAWAYYTQRSLLPNVLFVSLLLIGVYYVYQISQRRHWYDHALAGLCFAAAIAVRPSEAIWICIPVIAFTALQYRRLFLRYLPAVFLGALPIVVILFFSLMGNLQSISGNGYQLIQNNNSSFWSAVQHILLPFGFHPRLIIWVFENYVVWWQFPFFIFALIGMITSTRHFKEKIHQRYLWLTIFVGLFLLCYYGSWLVQDNPIPGAVTIGTSYVRYLLPLYVLLSPYVAWALISISRQLLPRYQRTFLIFVSISLLVFSMQKVILDPQEGWLTQRQDLQIYERTLERVQAALPAKSIIMTLKADKYIWPSFTVITPQGDNGYLQAAASLVRQGYAVYFLDPIIDSNRENDLQNQWKDYGLSLGAPVFEAEGLGLYNLKAQP